MEHEVLTSLPPPFPSLTSLMCPLGLLDNFIPAFILYDYIKSKSHKGEKNLIINMIIPSFVCFTTNDVSVIVYG